MFRMQRRRISAKNSFIERPSEHSSYYLLWCSPHFIINNNLLFLFRCLSHFLSHSSLALCALCDSVEFSHLRIGTANELFDEFAMSIRLTARLNNRGTCGRDVYWRLCVYDAHSAHAFHHCVRLYLCVCVCVERAGPAPFIHTGFVADCYMRRKPTRTSPQFQANSDI